MKRLSSVVLLIVVIGLRAGAQGPWSLEECIKYALSNNLQIKMQELNKQLSYQQVSQSTAALFPTLNGSATHVFNYGQTIDMFTNQFATEKVRSNNFYLQSSVTVFSGLRMLNTVFQNRLDYQASGYDLEKVKNDISLGIATAYLQVLYSIEMEAVARNQIEITKQQLERTRIMVEADAINRGSLLTLEAQLASEEYQLVTAENQRILAYITLTQMLDLPTADGFEIEQPDVALPDASSLLVSPEEIYQKALGTQPEIKSAELRLLSAKKGVSIAWGSISPILSVSASWGTGYSGASREVTGIDTNGYYPIGTTTGGELVYGPAFSYSYQTKSFGNQIQDNENKSVGFYLNIPIFNKWQTKTAIASSKINYSNSQYLLQTTKNTLSKNIQQAYADAVAALNKYHAAQKAVAAMDESFRYSDKRHNLGLLTGTEYDDAKNKLVAAQSDMLQSKYEYIFRLKILDFYQGIPITLK